MKQGLLLEKLNLELKISKLLSLSLSSYCLVFALSIALSQIFLILFAVLLITLLLKQSDNDFLVLAQQLKRLGKQNSLVLRLFYYPALTWLAVMFVNGFFGLDVRNTIFDLFKFGVYFILPFLVLVYLQLDSKTFDYKFKKYLTLLFIGQGIAAAHSVLELAWGSEIRVGIPGPLTEAGQISLLFPVLLATLYAAFSQRNYSKEATKEFWKLGFLTSLLFVTLLINLKRGPWMSVFITSFLLFSAFSWKRGVVVVLLGALVCLLPPVWQRLAEFHEHFFIGGGRFDMWKLGFQLIERFPLGIGFSNSDFMRQFDSSLPLLHRHMHNNLLNVTLEGGILGGLIYIWWFLNLIIGVFKLIQKRIRLGLRLSSGEAQGYYLLLSLAFLLCIVGFQVAGIVEYNFGDGEIKYLFLVLMGLMLAALGRIEGRT